MAYPRSGLGLSFATAVPALPPFQLPGQRGQDIHDQVFGEGPWAGQHPTRFELYTSTNPAHVAALSKEIDAALFNQAVVAGIVPKTPAGLVTFLSWTNLGHANGMALNPEVFAPFYAWYTAAVRGDPLAGGGLTPTLQGAVNRSRWIQSIVKGSYYNSAYQPKLDWVLADTTESDGTVKILGVRSIYQVGWGVDPTDNVLRRVEGQSPWIVRPDFGSATPAQFGSGTESSGILPGYRIRTLSQLSAEEQQTFAGPSSTPASETYTPPPLIGTGATAAPPPRPEAPIPIPPDGSVIHVPNAGSGEEPTIKLPGSTEFVPISAVPPEVWKAAAEYAASPVTGAPNLTVIGPGAATAQIGGAESLGGMSGLLLIGAAFGLVLLARKGRS